MSNWAKIATDRELNRVLIAALYANWDMWWSLLFIFVLVGVLGSPVFCEPSPTRRNCYFAKRTAIRAARDLLTTCTIIRPCPFLFLFLLRPAALRCVRADWKHRRWRLRSAFLSTALAQLHSRNYDTQK